MNGDQLHNDRHGQSFARRKRVLFVSYVFPPAGGVGVLRATKFVKYLPEFGWDVTVLTAENPSVPLRDESLVDEIPPGTVIRTAKTLEPGYAVKRMVARTSAESPGLRSRISSRLKRTARSVVNTILQPDTCVLWYPQAVRAGLRILREEPHDAIVVTAPPFSSLLIGAALARKTGVPLVFDYRDEWTINKAYFENAQQDRFSNWVQQRMQQRAVRTAHAIIATTPGSARTLGEIAARAGSGAVSAHIYNGFDPADFPSPDETLERRDYGNGVGLLRIAFVGTLWRLTSIAPFVKAVQRLAERQPELLGRLEVVVAGRQVGVELEHLQTLKSLPCHTVHLGYLEHGEALRLMATSDWLLQLLSDLPCVDRVVASKLFEYMGARRPILAITGRGDHWDLVSQLPTATVCLPHETERIASALQSRLEAGRGETLSNAGDEAIRRFERRQLTAELAQVLDGLLSTDLPDQDQHGEESVGSKASFATVAGPLVGAPG